MFDWVLNTPLKVNCRKLTDYYILPYPLHNNFHPIHRITFIFCILFFSVFTAILVDVLVKATISS